MITAALLCSKISSSSSFTLPKSKSKSHLVLLLPLALHHCFSTSPNPALYQFLVHTHHFSPKSASQIASLLTHFRNPQGSHSILSFFKQNGFSTPQLEKTVRGWPKLLSANLDRAIKPKFKFFHDLGISGSDVSEIIASDPIILKASLNNKVVPTVTLLINLLGSKIELVRCLKGSGWLLFCDLDNSLIPNVELFKKCGVSFDQILWMMHFFPRFMLRRHNDMKKLVERVDAMGVSRSSKVFIHAVRVINSMSDEIWELKLRTLREVGFSDDDIIATFRTTPIVFGLSEEKIKKTTQVLLENGKYNPSCIVNSPASLGYSIEKRYKPRLRVLELLEAKKLIQRWPPFSSFCKVTDKKFFDTYVTPFRNEIGDDVYMELRASATKVK